MHHKQRENAEVASSPVVDVWLLVVLAAEWSSSSLVAFWRRITGTSFDGPVSAWRDAGTRERRLMALPLLRRSTVTGNERPSVKQRRPATSESASERCRLSISGALSDRRRSSSTECSGSKAGSSWWGAGRRRCSSASDRWTLFSSRLSVENWSAILGVIADSSSCMALVRCWMHSSSFEPATMTWRYSHTESQAHEWQWED